MFGTCLGYLLDMFWKCFRHVWDMVWDMFGTCFGHVLDMFWTCFGYVSDMFWTFSFAKHGTSVGQYLGNIPDMFLTKCCLIISVNRPTSSIPTSNAENTSSPSSFGMNQAGSITCEAYVRRCIAARSSNLLPGVHR